MSVNPELVKSFAFYGTLLAGKTLIMAFLTARQRFATKVFANPEDCKRTKGKVRFDEGKVERVRRAHLNDLENILPFMFIGASYLLTNPSTYAANMCFRIFAGARFVHTFVYLFEVPQPSRALAFGVGMVVNFYMVYNVLTALA